MSDKNYNYGYSHDPLAVQQLDRIFPNTEAQMQQLRDENNILRGKVEAYEMVLGALQVCEVGAFIVYQRKQQEANQ